MSESGKKGDWRDSNWYVSITGFWREFRKHRIGILGIILLVLFVGMAIFAPVLATHSPRPNDKIAPGFLAPSWMNFFDPTGVKTQEYMVDPLLDIEPTSANIIINGTHQDEFSSQYFADDPDGDPSHLDLTWTHTPGVMSWRDQWNKSSDLPASYDFIYMTQSFEWEYDSMPSDVNMTLKFGVTRTGDFAEYVEGGLMYKVYVWLIDSSGDWRRVYRSNPPYPVDHIERVTDMNYFDLDSGWRGMITDEDGTQKDPTDVLTVAIGLAPNILFQEYLGANPELNWTGSVTATIESISMFVYGDYFGLLGTTDKGADAWSQLVYGSRISLTIGILATGLSTAVGVIVGLVAGYFGGKVDEALMRVVDFLLVIPGLPLMMVLAAFLGPTIENIIVVIAILGWTGTSRLIRSQVMAEKNKAYVESARAIGASDTYIIFRHILPNVTPILFANITLGVVGAILSESGLAFLGLTDPNEPSWGRMLADAQGTGGFSEGAWWVVVFPGMMITILSLAFTFVGHTLDQVLNPRLRER